MTERVIPASSASHVQMVFMLCPTASAASMSGQSARIWPDLVAGFSARRRARRVRAWIAQSVEFMGSSFPDTDPLSTKRLPKAIGDGQQRISPLKNYGNPEGRIGTEAREDLELRQIATDHDRTRRSLALVGSCDRSRRFATVGMQCRPASGRQRPVVEHKGSGMRRCRFVGLRAPITSGYGGFHFSTAASRLGCAVVFENFRPIASRHALQESLSI